MFQQPSYQLNGIGINFHDKKSVALITTVNESTHHFSLISLHSRPTLYLNANNTAKMILFQLHNFSSVYASSTDITSVGKVTLEM